MGAKAVFNPVARHIDLIDVPVWDGSEYVSTIDVKTDIYSDGKEDWRADETLRRLVFPVTAIGGQPRPGGFLGTSFFIKSDWKIHVYDFGGTPYRLRIIGNFYSEDGTSPFALSPGQPLVIEQNLSSIVEVAQGDAAAAAQAVWSADLSASPSGTAGATLRKVQSIVKAVLGLS